MTFCEPKEETSADEGPQRECSTSWEMGDRDLSLPPTMSPDLEKFLGCPQPAGVLGIGGVCCPNHLSRIMKNGWNVGQGNWTPHWWEELTTIPDVEDI